MAKLSFIGLSCIHGTEMVIAITISHTWYSQNESENYFYLSLFLNSSIKPSLNFFVFAWIYIFRKINWPTKAFIVASLPYPQNITAISSMLLIAAYRNSDLKASLSKKHISLWKKKKLKNFIKHLGQSFLN